MNIPNEQDYIDYSKSQEFLKEAGGFNHPTIKQLLIDLHEIEKGMADVVRPIFKTKESN